MRIPSLSLALVVLLSVLPSTSACKSGAGGDGDAGPALLGPRDTSAVRRPPPLRQPHPPTPPLPDLPALADHAAPLTLPSSADLSGHPCRAVWTGLDVAPLACARALLFGAAETGDNGAAVLVPRALLSRDPAVLPAVVDHRREGSEGPVRDQSFAPACTAFATAAAIDHELLRWSSRSTPVSVMQIWARYHSPEVGNSLTSNIGEPLGLEAAWPFSAEEATSWVSCADYPRPPRGGCGRPVDDARARRVQQRPVGVFTEAEYLGMPDVAVLVAKIAAGADVVLALELPATFAPRGVPGARYVPHYTTSGGPDAGHALLLAGYARLPHGVYFLAHNSWGPRWGDGGYAWIHEKTVTTWGRQTVAIDADPSDASPPARANRSRGETTCAGALVPDSIRGTCAPPCADHSPRHDGVCAIAGQCPASYVNLTGACVLAAPAVQGSDPGTGIAWTCGPGGCTYELPRASDPTCTGARCRASCPAPDFHLARMGTSLVCVE